MGAPGKGVFPKVTGYIACFVPSYLDGHLSANGTMTLGSGLSGLHSGVHPNTLILLCLYTCLII